MTSASHRMGRDINYLHEQTVVFSDGNFADFAEVLDLNVFNLVHVRLVTKHLTTSHNIKQLKRVCK